MALKFDEQLSRLQKPDRSDMTDKEYALFDKSVKAMLKNWGFINNLFKILPLNAKEYIGFLNLKSSLYNDSCYLSDAQKEMIGVVVSSYNCCHYCLTTHGDNLRGLWKNPQLVDTISHNYRAAKNELTKVDYSLCEYAWYVTAHPQEIDQAQVDKLRDAGLDDHQILEAAFVAGFFNYTNRWVSTIAPVANPGHFNHNRNFTE
ncbi:MAG: peroxidase-related enzyme [Anaerovibrio sp.]|uniref:peroxidase-related enzyme n=1 Tax=Anaerovibrio sp. TaxID=1872532 RepID=UPI0025EF0BC2|nr:peroxidase-related enzyme [Anaerovibrio sp.]MCR5175625.1 peroxidase-related enzyme [Anaerovibrio sp.]